MNQYKTTEEKSAQWGVTQKTVQNLCKQGRIPQAIKRAGVWFIPDDVPNPLKNTKANAQPYNFVGTKKKIFDSSIGLFVRKGFENVTIKDIADSVGINQSAVYNHFPSKQKILDTVYDFYLHYFLVDRPELESIEPVLRNGSLLEIIKSVRYEFKDAYVRQKMIEISVLVFHRQGVDERAKYMIKNLMIDEGIAFVDAVFNKAISIGRLAPFDTRTISVLINIVRMYTLNISIVDSSSESMNTMLEDEQALYEMAAGSLIDLGCLPLTAPLAE